MIDGGWSIVGIVASDDDLAVEIVAKLPARPGHHMIINQHGRQI